MPYGCHISIRYGFLRAAKTALAMNAGAFQYFPKNPRSLTIKKFDRREAEACAAFCAEHGLRSIAHAPYPTNLAIPPSELRQATVHSILNDLAIAEACGSIGVVVHFGKWKGDDPLEGYRYIVETLNEVLEQWEGRAMILLENQAGEGTVMGTTFEELTQIRSLTVRPESIGFCFDTCHAFASGLWNGRNWPEVEEAGRTLHYWDHLRAVHLNDSQYPSGMRKDRHANIGHGRIGEEHLRSLISRPWLRDIPVILETPHATADAHLRELAWMRQNGIKR